MFDEPPGSIIFTMKELVPLEILRHAIPMMVIILKWLLIHRHAMHIHESGTNVKETIIEVLHGSNSDIRPVLEAHSPREYLSVTVRPKQHRQPYQRQGEPHTEQIRVV